MDHLNTCPLCKKDYYGPHYCEGRGFGGLRFDSGARPASHLTEDDVRRIVRDEIQRAQAAKEHPHE